MNKNILFIPLVAFLVLAGIFAPPLVRNQGG
ncbi:DsbE family thiol:disulfide interchange protein, partial [Vibrio sp. 704]|nr:DsbE family thiol:disulfide interchange protein [Vibrio sp. 704]